MYRPFSPNIDTMQADPNKALGKDPPRYFYTKVDKLDLVESLSCADEAYLWSRIRRDLRSRYCYPNFTMVLVYGLATAFLFLFYFMTSLPSAGFKDTQNLGPVFYRSQLDCSHYQEALSKSILFFEAQRSGKLPEAQRVTWRKDSGLKDGESSNVDLSGGYSDAGDNVKFGFPMAFSITSLAWSILEHGRFMEKAQELNNARDAVRWGTDYLLKTYSRPNELWAQVGEPYADHECWARPEDVENLTPRTAYKVDPRHPGSDLAGETAAALAAASIIFKGTDPEYSKKLLDTATEIFKFADSYRGRYSDSVPEACPFYCSYSGYKDELLWGATWLYKASLNVKYLLYIKRNGKVLGGTSMYETPMDWDNKYAGVQVLLAEVYLANPWNVHFKAYKDRVDEFVCGTLPELSPSRVTFTPGGLIYTKPATNFQYVTSTAFLLTAYSKYLKRSSMELKCDHVTVSPRRLTEVAQQQVDYLLGVNPNNMSYMVGFGSKYPKYIHHRAASNPSVTLQPKNMTCEDGWNYFAKSEGNPNVLVGAVVGGPDRYDRYDDIRKNWIQSEPAIYINSPLAGVLAYLYGENSLSCDLISLDTMVKSS